LLGIAGAALGLSDRELWDPQAGWSKLRVSVWMDAPSGKARDMWTVLKIKDGKLGERSPYFRELLFYVRYKLAYGGTASQLEELARAFRDPVFPLSLGRDDELLLVEDVTLYEAQSGEPVFGGTVLPTDIRKIPRLKPALAPGTAFEPPVVERLPVAFEVDKEGVRHPRNIEFFSFLPPRVQIEVLDL
ncbi:CRISPR-associated protein Cas5, partial [Thermogutta sp.]|uniref:CRISPR-associated protein Cas5 n=1 Tax=Thermogutta sp. TaxID=1962930 RepID=UPI00321FF991